MTSPCALGEYSLVTSSKKTYIVEAIVEYLPMFIIPLPSFELTLEYPQSQQTSLSG